MRSLISAARVTVSLLAFLSLATTTRADDIDTVYNRQVNYIIRTTPASAAEVSSYITNIQSDGAWPEVNYSAGCDAQRSSWPAGEHWTRILKMAAAYKGKVAEYKDKPELLSALRLAMGYWFENDYSTIGDGSCMDREFLPNNNCPCGTPGLWGPNWFSNVIQVPTRSGKACTLLRSELFESELANCTLIASRAYAPFYRNPQPGYVSGANIIDMAVIGISAGLLENNRAGNASRIADAYGRVHAEVIIQPDDRVDGIKPDGSFQQHRGIIYNGNYGKDFSNSLIELELQALGTQFQASKPVQDIFGSPLEGSRWMTFTNVVRKVVHWDFSVIGRFIAYPIADSTRASAGLQMALDEVRDLGNGWNQKDLIQFGNSLTGANDNTANSGQLTGNRMFWNSDYMVHRTDQTVTTVKMLSTRTTTGECTNSENPYGFHLSDGVVYNYSTGTEYEDMFAALDYNILPGTTTDYGATPLNCGTARRDGIDTYAGGVQAGDVGMAAMRYVNPFSQNLRFYKAWFFFPQNVQHVLVSNVQQSNSGSRAPVFSVLDQRLRAGDVYVNGSPSQSGNYTEAKSLWHDGTGYAFPTDPSRAIQVSVSLESRTGDWSRIGTSKVPPSSKDLFAAWIPHKKASSGGSNTGQGKYTPIEYSVFPATSSVSDFQTKVTQLAPRTVVNTETASAAIDSSAMILGVAFWKAEGGSVVVKDMGIQVQVDRAVALMLKFSDESRTRGTISVADPTHGTGRVNVKITWNQSKRRGHRRMEGCIGHYCSTSRPSVAVGNGQASVGLDLPEGGMAGSTVTSAFERTG